MCVCVHLLVTRLQPHCGLDPGAGSCINPTPTGRGQEETLWVL